MRTALAPIHPFPARMSPQLVWRRLPRRAHRLTVLDPMVGSGTTVAMARLRGHRAIGFDTDPLAVLIARAWIAQVDHARAFETAEAIVRRARKRAARLRDRDAYPAGSDDETKRFIRYWFDIRARRQLRALSDEIRTTSPRALRTVLWCAFSRLLITKVAGASRAMDVSHSRPHRVYAKAPADAFESFPRAVRHITTRLPFHPRDRLPRSTVRLGDARRLPLKSASVDVVITSPPYLNAIDYLRGHRFSLVWIGEPLKDLRRIRGSNVGTEVGLSVNEALVRDELGQCLGKSPPSGQLGRVFLRYAVDMNLVLAEVARVLVGDGRAVFVVGDSVARGMFLSNSALVASLARRHGLNVVSRRPRIIPANRRYLPPPSRRGSGQRLGKRMTREVVLTFLKAGPTAPPTVRVDST